MARTEKCFTYTWKLENVSYCLQKRGAVIKSPAFVINSIDETKWKLGLYPRGKQYGNYIGFYLYREGDSKGPEYVEIKYELELVAEGSSNQTRKEKFKYVFPKSHGHGSQKFALLKYVFIEKRSLFLPQDTLIARCKIWKTVGEMAEHIQCLARTRIGAQKKSFVWNVKNFSSFESEKKDTYQIKSIENDEPLMSLYLSLSGGLNSEEIIRFELCLHDQTIQFCSLRLSILNACGNRIECNQEVFWFDGPSKSKEFKFIFTKNKLMAMQSSYLTDDILSLHWEWTFSNGVISEDILNVEYSCNNSENKFSNAENLNKQKALSLPYSLNDGLKSLYDENFLCDVKLKTNTGTFPAHKIILSASSSVFKAMFSSDMKEKDSNCVHVEDLSDDTIHRMLIYIYTARTEDVTWESASDLYVAADKYAILSFKSICSSYMKDNLSLNNACDALLLSDFHADDDLKSAVQDYIFKNVKGIINSDGWKLLMEANAKLAAETLCLLHK
ncbi:Speckle-type POZ protein B like protein [Argiope bruennichi]|uniref:Speckle-type POZ protein B like protein n=1 Tax=Argiope bruennichi TaxID=94029 RepID=A0A8T0EDY0_ARGBR|nr:Speckle-type POZ protein B like protein [Argiope bruennichi]